MRSVADSHWNWPKGAFQSPGIVQQRGQRARIEVRDHARASTSVPSSSTTPTARPWSATTLRDPLPGADLHAARLGLRAHRLRDRAHAADRVAPGALLAVHLAEHVVQQHVGRARRIRAREVAHHAVEAEAGLDRLGIEPAVQPVARGHREEVEHVAPRVHRQRLEAPRGFPGAEEVAGSRRRRWAASPAAGRAARRPRGRGARSTRAAAGIAPPRSARPRAAWPRGRRPPGWIRHPASGRKFENGRSTTRSPCSASAGRGSPWG